MPEKKVLCTDCWHEVHVEDVVCPNCRSDLSTFDDLTYEEKLIKALMHFEPQTPIRAAEILALRESKQGAAALVRAFVDRADLDVIMGRAFLKAIARIAGEDEKVVASRLKKNTFKSATASTLIEDLSSNCQ